MGKRHSITPFDYAAIQKKIEWFLEMEEFGHGVVEISENPDGVFAPKAFYELCLKYNIKPVNAINMVLSDFCIRYYNGNNAYEQGILNRIRMIEDEKLKREILNIILNSKN